MVTVTDAPTAPLTTSVDCAGPFFESRHVALVSSLRKALEDGLRAELHRDPTVAARALGEELDLYRYLLPQALGGAENGRPADPTALDVRSLVLVREALGQRSALCDSIFAVQGLGSYPIANAGSEEQRQRYLPAIVAGQRIAAFALTEPDAGSDVGALSTVAEKTASGYRLTGEKTFISNATIAHQFIVFAKTDPDAGTRGISAFVVDSDAEGLSIEPIPMSVPHPLGRVRLSGVEVPDAALLGAEGQGFKLAMTTLDRFRISVGAAANGMAARALMLARGHTMTRKQFGKPLAEQQIVQGYLADMATELAAAQLLVARAAHRADTSPDIRDASAAAAMAKMYATESAQRTIDRSVQLHGGRGVVGDSEVDMLYREIRPLRIYEGATEVQKVIIARLLLSQAPS